MDVNGVRHIATSGAFCNLLSAEGILSVGPTVWSIRTPPSPSWDSVMRVLLHDLMRIQKRGTANPALLLVTS